MPNAYLTMSEQRELAEYDKIVFFAQQVTSGTHPRVKIPTNFVQDFDQIATLPNNQYPVEKSKTLPFPSKIATISNALLVVKSIPTRSADVSRQQWSSSYPLFGPFGASNYTSSRSPQPLPSYHTSNVFTPPFFPLHPETSMDFSNNNHQDLKAQAETLQTFPSYDNTATHYTYNCHQVYDIQPKHHQPLPKSQEPTTIIDYTYNYYKDLSVQPGVPSTSIIAGYNARAKFCSPNTSLGKERWFSDDPDVRAATHDAWFRAQKAYTILSDPKLRRKYDEQYCGPPVVAAKQPRAKGKERTAKTASRLKDVKPRITARLGKRRSARGRITKMVTSTAPTSICPLAESQRPS